LQEELAKRDPNLASVASFLGRVCGTDPETERLQAAARLAIQNAISPGGSEAVTPAVAEGDPSTLEIVTAITGIDTLTTRMVECLDPIVPLTDTAVLSGLTTIAINREVIVGPCLNVDTLIIDESDVVSLADTVMSVGGSSSEGD